MITILGVSAHGVPMRMDITGLDDDGPWLTIAVTCRRCRHALARRRYYARLGVPPELEAHVLHDGLISLAHTCGETN